MDFQPGNQGAPFAAQSRQDAVAVQQFDGVGKPVALAADRRVPDTEGIQSVQMLPDGGTAHSQRFRQLGAGMKFAVGQQSQNFFLVICNQHGFGYLQ